MRAPPAALASAFTVPLVIALFTLGALAVSAFTVPLVMALFTLEPAPPVWSVIVSQP